MLLRIILGRRYPLLYKEYLLKSQSQEHNFMCICGWDHTDNPLNFERLILFTQEFDKRSEEQRFLYKNDRHQNSCCLWRTQKRQRNQRSGVSLGHMTISEPWNKLVLEFCNKMTGMSCVCQRILECIILAAKHGEEEPICMVPVRAVSSYSSLGLWILHSHCSFQSFTGLSDGLDPDTKSFHGEVGRAAQSASDQDWKKTAFSHPFTWPHFFLQGFQPFYLCVQHQAACEVLNCGSV